MVVECAMRSYGIYEKGAFMAGLFGTDGCGPVLTPINDSRGCCPTSTDAGRWFADTIHVHNMPGQGGYWQGYKVSGYMIESAMVAGFTSWAWLPITWANSNTSGGAFDAIFAPNLV